jgi:hypothetical protein
MIVCSLVVCASRAEDAPGRIRRWNRKARVSLRPSGRGSATKEQPPGDYFGVRFRTEKYAVPYFLAESEATVLRPTERGGRRKSPACRGRGFKCTGDAELVEGA